MADHVSCESCTHFRRDAINPVTGLGFCTLRKVAKYPMEPHYCRHFEGEDDGDQTNDLHDRP